MADPTAKFILTAEDRTGRAIASADRNLKTISRTANSVRSMFGVLGVAVSGRAFVGWISGAIRAAEVTGEHAEQIKAAKAALDSMKKASDELALSIGTALVPAMQAFTGVLIGWGRIIGNADPFPLEKQIEDTRDKLIALQNQMAQPRGMAMRGAEIRAEYERLLKVMDELEKKQRVALGLDMDMGAIRMRRAVSGMGRIGGISDKFPGAKRPEVNIDWLLPEDELQEIIVEAREMTVDELMKPFPSAAVAKMFAPIKKEAALSAEFLGMTFKDSFDGWLIDGERGFKDLLRRMAIQMATSALFKSLAGLFPGGSFFANFFGGSRASGGSVREGKMYKVHPGEAFFTPGSDGHVAAAGGPSMHFETHIDARGADPSLAARLPKILAENNQRLKAEIRHTLGRGR